MKTFKDNAGRTWTIAVNVDAIKRVKALLGINLLEVLDGKLVERFASDPILLVDVVYAICKTEADAQNVSDVQFGQAMGGNSLDLATTALMEELVDFFPSQRRAMLRKALEKFHQAETMVLDSINAKLEGPELDAQIKKIIEAEPKLPGAPVGNSQV